MSVSPPTWTPGTHDDHEVAVLEVLVRRDKATGRVYSTHRPQSEFDEKLLLSWPSGGLEQATFALLVEALRKEALLSVLLDASKDPQWLARFRNATSDERKAAITRLAAILRQSVGKTVERISEAALQEALEVVLHSG